MPQMQLIETFSKEKYAYYLQKKISIGQSNMGNDPMIAQRRCPSCRQSKKLMVGLFAQRDYNLDYIV